VIFTDEAQLTRDEIQNFHNHHLWTDENSNAILPSHHQQQFFVSIWAGIAGDNLSSPLVLPNKFTGGITYFLGKQHARFLD
jgi:hypothetical protein